MVEHVQSGWERSQGLLWLLRGTFLCCYDVCEQKDVRVEDAQGKSMIRRRARQRAVLVTLLSQLVFLATLTAPRRVSSVL